MIFLHPSTLISILLIVISAAASVSAQSYQNCSTQLFECGDLRIGFPFWGLDRPSYCGLPEFNLTCTSDRSTILSISGLTYQVLQIEPARRTLTVLRTGYRRNFCRTAQLNTTLDPNQFDFTADTRFVNLYHDCPPAEPIPIGAQLPERFNCSNVTADYFLTTEDLIGGYQPAVRSWLGSCGSMVRVPANRTAVELLQNEPAGLMGAIGRGFGVRWRTNSSLCGSCSTSGGECGFNETAGSFACFCRDSPPQATECDTRVDFDEPAANRQQLLLKILLPIAAVFLVVLIVVLCHIRIKALMKKAYTAGFNKLPIKNGNYKSKGAKFGSGEPPNLQAFSFSDIEAATDNFSSDNLLGSGGYGPVYKGVLPGGEEIAVKRLSKSSTQGLLEFKNEVSLTARLQHVNLVRVVGFCTEKEEKLLVYEFMPCRSLDLYLFDPVRRLELDWEKRLKIIDGVIQGLLYLQEYSNFTIIHRDLKASNILLDDGMNPKISDFGMAKLFRKDLYEANTSRIVGTRGYVPPEYVKNGIYSMKYDVYSFGVSLLQIISGKKTQRYYGPDEDMDFLEYAYELWKTGEGMEFCDPSLDDSSSQCKLMTCMQVALLCVQDDPEDRPTMLEVSYLLRNGAVGGIAVPKRPVFSVRMELVQDPNSRTQEEVCSYNVADISQVDPR